MLIETPFTDSELHFSIRQAGVYIIRHAPSGREYVGSSINLYKRFSKHRSDLRASRHHSPMLQNAWNAHDEGEFEFVVVELVSNDADLLAIEQTWMDKHEPFYNTCKVAGNRLGYRVSSETKAKVSAALLGKPKSAEHRRKMIEILKTHVRPITDEHRAVLNAALLGVKKSPRTQEHIAKIAAANTGKTRPLEAREKCRKAMLDFKRTEENKRKYSEIAKNRSAEHRAKLGAAKAKGYLVTSPTGEVFEVFNMREFCRNNPCLRQGSMCAVANGKQTNHKGWTCLHVHAESAPA